MVVVETNKIIEGNPLTVGEFLKFIGVWLLLSMTSGHKRRDFWSASEVDIFQGALFRLHGIISKTRFEAILRALKITNCAKPPFNDRFWEVRQVLQMWKHHVQENFVPSWVSCLDESMSIWFNKWICPGWVFC